MALADTDPTNLRQGRAPSAAQAAAAGAAGAPRDLPLGTPVLAPSVRDAQLRQAARVRQAVVARWLRRLSDPRP